MFVVRTGVYAAFLMLARFHLDWGEHVGLFGSTFIADI